MAKERNASRISTNRRAFLKAGLLAAGAAFGSGFVGCDSGGFSIPCLGPAPPPAAIPGMTYIRASEIGCALDCDLSTGRNKFTGGAATDDGPRMNAAMAAATENNPITLIIDGSALISGLFPPAGGNWSIAGLGCGTGFFVKTGTNNDGIHNGPPNAPIPAGPPAPLRGSNVSLSNFTLNGNQGNGHSGDSTTGLRQGSKQTWFCGIHLLNLDNIRIDKVVVVNTPAYHIRFSNVGNVTVSGSVMKSRGLSTDGLHFDGPANNIAIWNCDFATGDDSIALNCPEGYSGNISEVSVTNCTFNSLSLMRLYTANGYPNTFQIDAVSVSNCKAKLTEAAFLIGLYSGSKPNSIASLTVTDCTITAPTVLGMAENFGDILLQNVTFSPSQSGVVWVQPQGSDICAFVRPSPLYGNIASVGSTLRFENCKISRNGNSSVAALILDNDSSIENLFFDGFRIQGAASPTPIPALIRIGSGSITGLTLKSVDSRNMATAVSSGGFSNIGSVAGSGLLETGWEFPDAVMADDVPYISANSGLASIKIDGVVEPYSG